MCLLLMLRKNLVVHFYLLLTMLIIEGWKQSQREQTEPFETEYLDEGSIPAVQSDYAFDYAVVNGSINIADTLRSDALTTGDDVQLEDAHEVTGEVIAKGRKRKACAVSDLAEKFEKSPVSGVENGTGKWSMQLRKRKTTPNFIYAAEDGSHGSGLDAENLSDYVVNEDENINEEYTVEDSNWEKEATRKTRNNDKPARKCKDGNEVPNQITEKPRKKFSHSTRSKRRRVDKALLEIPEDDIDPRTLPLKDLILLAEFRERTSKKEATTSGTQANNQSGENFSTWDASYDEEGRFTSEQGTRSNDDQESNRVTKNANYFNYHSFMDKPARMKWSKQDTELFYEAVRQFGTDFSMIQQLFPGCSRHQVKLKYKKEERQHPLRLAEAVANRAKGHSHFEIVIERLKAAAAAAAAQAEQDLSGDESMGLAGDKEEVEEAILDPDVEPSKSEHNEEDVAEKMQYSSAEEGSPQHYYY